MAVRLSVQKTKLTPTRKLKFLPRIGLTLDVAGKKLTFKQAPFFEAIANMRKDHFSLKNFVTISNQILDEISIEKKSGVARRKKVTKK